MLGGQSALFILLIQMFISEIPRQTHRHAWTTYRHTFYTLFNNVRRNICLFYDPIKLTHKINYYESKYVLVLSGCRDKIL